MSAGLALMASYATGGLAVAVVLSGFFCDRAKTPLRFVRGMIIGVLAGVLSIAATDVTDDHTTLRTVIAVAATAGAVVALVFVRVSRKNTYWYPDRDR